MQNTSAYSAFGSTRPVHDAAGERIRWFCPRLILNSSVLSQSLDEMTRLDVQTSVTRLTLRVVSEGNLSSNCNTLITDRGFQVEAKIPFGGVRKLVMTYIGKCEEQRRSNNEDIQQEQLMLDTITQQKRKGPATILENFQHLSDFRVEPMSAGKLSAVDLDRLIWMHKEIFPTFPYDFRKKLEMMFGQAENYRMAIVRSLLDDQIYAFSNLELNSVTLDDGSCLRLAEFDNSMRVNFSPVHGVVNGLGAILRLKLASNAARCNVDLCHSESRAGLAAINSISYDIGMKFGGALEKHLLISGHKDIEYKELSRFETMNVWYLDRESLKSVETEYGFAMA